MWAFLSHLAIHVQVAASDPECCLACTPFLLPLCPASTMADIGPIAHAKQPRRLPTVFTQEEVTAVLAQLHSTSWLMASLLYGAGLCLMECLQLRVKDLDFASQQIVVRDGQGARDRLTLLPQTLVAPLQRHLITVQALYEEDAAEGYGDVSMPYALVQVIIKRCLQSCGPSRCVSHDLRDRLRGPVDRVCALVPCGNKLFERGLAHHWRRKVCDAATLPWQTRKPRLNWLHPRAMDGGEVADEARMALQPWADCLTMMR